jgi:hypothetical protein
VVEEVTAEPAKQSTQSAILWDDEEEAAKQEEPARPAAAKEDDMDDLFGDDEEESAPKLDSFKDRVAKANAEKEEQQSLQATKEKPKKQDRTQVLFEVKPVDTDVGAYTCVCVLCWTQYAVCPEQHARCSIPYTDTARTSFVVSAMQHA